MMVYFKLMVVMLVNDGEMLVNDCEMLVNDCEMLVNECEMSTIEVIESEQCSPFC